MSFRATDCVHRRWTFGAKASMPLTISASSTRSCPSLPGSPQLTIDLESFAAAMILPTCCCRSFLSSGFFGLCAISRSHLFSSMTIGKDSRDHCSHWGPYAFGSLCLYMCPKNQPTASSPTVQNDCPREARTPFISPSASAMSLASEGFSAMKSLLNCGTG